MSADLVTFETVLPARLVRLGVVAFEDAPGVHWITIDGNHVPITDKAVGAEHIRQATAKLGLGKDTHRALTQANKEGRIVTDAHLYHAIRHVQAQQAKGTSEKDAVAEAVRKHGVTPDVKPTAAGGVKLPGKAPLPFQAISDISTLYAASKSGDREQLAAVREDLGPDRLREASRHAHALRSAGVLDKALETHRNWLDEQQRAEGERWIQQAKRETDAAGETGRGLVQEAASQGRSMSFRDRATGRTHRYIELYNLNQSQLEDIYRTIRTPARDERMFPVPAHNNGPVKMWTLRELVVDEKKLPVAAVRSNFTLDALAFPAVSFA